MQETPIVWDPVYEVRLPWESKVFLLYLFTVLAISVGRSLNLARKLGWFSVSRRTSLGKANSGIQGPDLLAASALANRLVDDLPGRLLSESGHQPKKDNATALLRLMEQAEFKFLYSWEMCSTKVESIKRLAVLTSLLSVLLLVCRATTILAYITAQKVVGNAFVAGSMAEVFVLLALGIFVCALLYAIYTFYEGTLRRRRASWKYFCARSRYAGTEPGQA